MNSKTCNLNSQIIFWGLFSLLIIEILYFSISFSRATANNDVYGQLISSYKILSDFDLSAPLPNPLGISYISSLLILAKIDPLLFFYKLIPILYIITFLLLYNSIKPLGKVFSLLISFISVMHLFFAKSFNQFNAEIITYPLITLFFWFISYNYIQNNNLGNRRYMLLIIISILNIFFRDANVFFIMGGLLFVLFIYYNNNKMSKIIFFGMLIAISPIYFRFYNSITPHYNISGITILFERILIIIESFFIFLLNHSYETIFIRMMVLSGNMPFKIFCFVTLLIVIGLFFYKKQFFNHTPLIVTFYFVLSFSYLLGLSIANGIFNTNWILLYRVSAVFILPLTIFVHLLLRDVIKYKTIYIIYLLLLGQFKFIYAVRYELTNSPVRVLYGHYSNISELIYNNLEEHLHLTSININTGNHWTGRNLYLMLQYYNLVNNLDEIDFNIKSIPRYGQKTLVASPDELSLEFDKFNIIPIYLNDVYLVEGK